MNDSKKRSNLAGVKQYLQSGTLPKDFSHKWDRRTVRKRSKAFVVIKDTLYYTAGRPKRDANEKAAQDPAENPENDPGGTQYLRKCCISDEEQREAVRQCHVGEDGTHYGMDKTTERLANQYYWVGITKSVRKYLRNCSECMVRGIRGLNTTQNNISVVLSSSDGLIKEEQEAAAEPDVFFMPQEVSCSFWQKVEVQVFGPFSGSGNKNKYVAVALDTFSQFPEATVLDTISATSLTTFIMNLMCRYGVMEKICLLQNQTSKDVYLYLNMQDLELADITPTLLSQHANPADVRWQRVEKSLEHFVKMYPKMWDKCLEVFMVPLRISLPPEAEYAPIYLAHGREPVLPMKISHNSAGVTCSELRLTDETEEQTVELLMAAYGFLSKPAQQPVSRAPKVSSDILPIIKLESLSGQLETVTVPDDDLAALDEDAPGLVTGDEIEETAVVSQDEVKSQQGLRPRREGGRRKSETPSRVIAADLDDAFGEDASDFDDDDRDESYKPEVKSATTRKSPRTIVTRASKRKRIPTFKAQSQQVLKKEKEKPSAQTLSPQPSSPPEPSQQSDEETEVPVKRGRGRPRKVAVKTGVRVGGMNETSQYPSLSSDGKINSVEVLDLDIYYLVIKRYKERGVYPPHVSVIFKRAIRRICETLELKDGKLYGNVGNASGRLIITKERERFSLLRKAHAVGEEHVGRVRALRHLMDMNVFWKGTSLDLDAFIHACPECVIHNPMRTKSMVRIPSESKVLPSGGEDKDPHMSEDEEEESSYEDLIQYLTDSTFPASASEEQQKRIQQRAQSFCIINGSLYYKPSSRPDASPRQVLFAERLRQEALQEAHLEEDNHLSQQDTQAKLRQKYFWSGMTYDVMRYIVNCCMAESLLTRPIPHRNSGIQERVEKFHKYYLEGISDVWGSSGPSTSQSKEVQELASGAPECTITGPIDTITLESFPEGPILESSEQDTAVAEPAMEIGIAAEVGEHALQKESTSDSGVDWRTQREDDVIWKAVESIIGKLTKSEGGVRNFQITKPVAKVKVPATSVQQLRSQRAKAKHKCDHCGRIVKGDVAFKVHLYKHTGIKPFSCNVCGKMFSNRKSQRIHMRKHTGIRPYLCNQCGREFFRSASLRYHLKAHAKGQGQPVACDVCGRKFTTEHRLVRHKEFKHPAVAKVFMCNQCGKMFTAARSLKRHEQTHTGIRKYVCQFCSKSFFRKEYLNSHLTNHAEWDPEQEKQKPRRRAAKKPQKEPTVKVVVATPAGDIPPTNVIHWTETEQAASSISQSSLIDVDSYPSPDRQVSLVQDRLTTHTLTHSLTLTRPHFVVTSAAPSSHTVHHSVHPLAHAARLMSVAGPHGPMALTVSASGQPIEVLHTSHGQDILLQHESVPVQYEVECLTGDGSALTDADLNAIHMLAQASLTGHNNLSGQNILH